MAVTRRPPAVVGAGGDGGRDYCALDAIQRDNVTLVTDGIRRITETGIEAADGTQYDVDVIAYATGFHPSDYLFPMEVRDGEAKAARLLEGGRPRAHPFRWPGFPNLWSVYGPNTNGGLGPGAFHELVTRYALQCMERLILHDKKEIEPTEEAYWRSTRRSTNGTAARSERPTVTELLLEQAQASVVMCPFTGPEPGACCATRHSMSSIR